MLTDAAESMREWMVANRGMINTKVKEYIKKIPHYIEQIVKWAPKVLEYVEIFAKIVIGIKLARAALWLFNKAALASTTSMGNLGTASTTAMGKAQTSTAAATRGVGALGNAMGVLGAFAVGWEIGAILHEKLVEPFMAARHEASLLKAEMDDTQKRDLSKRGLPQLQKDLETIEKYKEAESKTFLSKMSGSFIGRALTWQVQGVREQESANTAASEARIRAAMRLRPENQYGPADTAGVSTPGWSEWGVSTMSSSTEHKESVEVVIKDETGRAKITKGKKTKGLKLVHTGAAP
jgi:hypothetical protein